LHIDVLSCVQKIEHLFGENSQKKNSWYVGSHLHAQSITLPALLPREIAL